MKTIEERAKEYARNKFRDVLLISERDYLELVRDFSADYAKMATEQQAIDIDKATEWIKNNYETIYWEVESPRAGKIADNIEKMFRKAMEE